MKKDHKQNQKKINNPEQKTIVQPETKPIPKKKTSNNYKDLFELFDSFFNKKGIIFLGISLTLMLIVSIALFDLKVSDGGDDSAYIVRAYQFIHHFEFPGGFQGPLYPIVLSIFVKIFGINLPVLKSLSILFMLAFLFFFHKSYINKVSSTLLYSVMILVSVNMFLLYFSSQTYSEAFFMMVQAVLFIVVFRYFIKDGPEQFKLKEDYKKFLILGLALFITSLSKNVGYISIFAVLFYFLLVKHRKTCLAALMAALTFLLPFEVIKRLIWSNWEIQLESQGTGLFYKDYYNPAKGSDDLWDFFTRFIDNSNLYLSKHLYMFLGFRPQTTITVEPVLTILTYGLFIAALIFIFRKNRFLLFTGAYVGIMCAVTFVILQKQWDQGRLIVIYYPYILLFIFGGFYYLLKNDRYKKFQFILLFLIPVIFIATLSATLPIAKIKKDIFRKNMKGDMLAGLTPDWANFIKMSQWAAENIPKGQLIASRKPDISFIYTERDFYPVFKVPNIMSKALTDKLNKDSLPVSIAVKLSDVFPKAEMATFYNNNRFYIRAFISTASKGPSDTSTIGADYVVYSFSEKHSKNIFKTLHEKNIQFRDNAHVFISGLKKEFLSFWIYDPDMILEQLKKDSVKFFIMPKLRTTGIKGKGVINTMDRLLYYIELKYPIFKEIKKIGKDEDARLLEILYDNLNGKANSIAKRDLNTPDIKNYIEICKWASVNLPKNTLIGTIDMGEAIDQTGCKFYPLITVPDVTNEALTEILNKDSLPVSAAVLLSDVFNNKNAGTFFNNYRFYIKAFVLGNKNRTGQPGKGDFTYIIYSFSKKMSTAVLKFFDEKKIHYNKNVSQFITDLRNEKANYFIYDPDLLLKKVKNDNVKYFILGNIRLNPAQKGQTVQTMNYLLYFIELKYPVVKEIHKVGNDENARILEIQYEKLNKKLVRF